VEEFSKDMGMELFYVSAKDGTNVAEAFASLTQAVLKAQAEKDDGF
jgi:hypothetical protein